ncbi:MAG: phage tail protein [Desulfovibrio sp.]|jgi:hypothetical protein|nr:phage tail protein [Desulfovibrio sp.]
MKRLWDDDQLAALLPGSISGDARMRAAAEALSPLLRKTALAVPNLLIFGRMGNQSPEEMIASLGRLTSARGGLPAPSTALLELLAWQLHVDFREAAGTDARLAGMVLNSIPWHRIKGTPAGIRDALALFGLTAGIEEDGRGDWWATYQLGLPSIADLETVKLVCRVAWEMQPARCSLWRIYTDVFDRRPIVVSEGPVLGDGWLSFHSGVPVESGLDDGSDVLVSFGARDAYQAEPYAADGMGGSFGSTVPLGFLAPYLDRFIVGRSRLSWPYPRDNPFVIGSLFSILWADRQTAGRTWRGLWDARSWLDYTGFDRKLPRWKMRHRAFSRSQIVPGWGEALSDNNARLGAAFAVTIDNPARLSAFRLSEHDPERRERRIHEFLIVAAGAATPEVAPGIPRTAGTSRLSAFFPEHPPVRVPVGIHSLLSTGIAARSTDGPQTGIALILASLGEELDPDAHPPAAVSGFAAQTWTGSWADSGRAWSTETKTTIQ